MKNLQNRLLISGATGFVGLNVVPYLDQRGYDVRVLSRKRVQEDTITYDTLKLSHFNEINTFIHLAGKAHDLKGTANSEEYFVVNTELTKMVFDKFLNSTASVFIFLSSVKAAADTVNGELTENTIPKPMTAYGKSKLAAEQYILEKMLPDDKRVYILRPCMIHGPFNKGNLSLLYNIVSNRVPYPLGKFNNKRSFLSVLTLCQVIEALITVKPDSGVYNVADDQSLSTTEVVEIMNEALGKKSRVWNIPVPLIKAVAKIGDVLPIPINSERLSKLIGNYVVSNNKIKRALGIIGPLDTRKGLENTIKSFVKPN